MDSNSMRNRIWTGGTIRPARKNEIPEIVSLVTSAWAQFRDGLSPVFFDAYLQDICDFESRWDEAELMIFELGGHIVGTISFYSDASRAGPSLPPDWAGFRVLAVHPAARGLGVGRMLIDACLEKARRAGTLTVGIHTADFMQAARDLYRKVGFYRCAEYDFRASEVLGFDAVEGDVAVTAYRLDLSEPAALSRYMNDEAGQP